MAIFSKSWCPYCKRVKELFSSNFAGLKVFVIEYVFSNVLACILFHWPFFFLRLDQREDGDSIQQYLQEKSGQRTVPNVYVSEYTVTYAWPFSQHRYSLLFFWIFDLDKQHIGGQALFFAANIDAWLILGLSFQAVTIPSRLLNQASSANLSLRSEMRSKRPSVFCRQARMISVYPSRL